jgi:hypothetical protein
MKGFHAEGDEHLTFLGRSCATALQGRKRKKCKVVPVLPLTEHRAMKAYWGSGGTAPPIL